MTTQQKLALSSDSVLVKLYGGVTGVTRRAEDKGSTRDGAAVESKNLVTTRQADAQEAERAKKLLSKLRAIVDSYTVTVLNLSIAKAGELADLREEIAPVQAQIEAHNAAAKHHHIDRALIMVPISLQADPAALTEVCRQICDELKAARGFFDVEKAKTAGNGLKAWLGPVDNWLIRTRGLGALFPTVTGQCIGDGIDSVKVLRTRVADLCRAKVKAGRAEENALHESITEVLADPSALGSLDSAIGLTAITDSDAKAASDEARAEGAGVEIH